MRTLRSRSLRQPIAFKHMKTSLFLSLLTVAVGARSQEKAPPNIIFILADDMGAWALGANGGNNAYTPNLDRLAASGALLKNCFSNGAVCSPSRAGLISGRYPSETGVTDIIPQGAEGGLSPALPTIPGVLKANGYHTALVGKWHLGEYTDAYMPKSRGYERFTGFPHGGMQSMSPEIMVEDKWKVAEGAYTEDLLTDYAIQYLEELDPGKTGKPFFLSLHYWAPHANVKFPRGMEPSYKGRSWLPLKPEDFSHWASRTVSIPDPEFPNLDKPLAERMMREYHSSVHSVDRNIGKLMDYLEEHSMTRNTIIIFTSDHGYMLGHNGLWHKGSGWWLTRDGKDPSGTYGNVRPNLYDNTLRVPCVIYSPGLINGKRVITEKVDFTDWFPTILGMAGLQPGAETTLRGRSILPLLQGRSLEWDNDLYAEYKELRTYRTQEWKLVMDFSGKGNHELYNLSSDPGEKQNRFGSREPDVVRQRKLLTGRLLDKMRSINDPLAAKKN